MWLLIGIIVLIVKFIVDALVRVPFASSLVPLISPLARMGILYPVGLAFILFAVWRDWRYAIITIALGSVLILLGGGSLV